MRWDWDSFSGAKWRVISNESIGTEESYNLVFSSCGKNGGRGCGGGSEVSQTREVEGAKLVVHNVWDASMVTSWKRPSVSSEKSLTLTTLAEDSSS